MLYVLFYIINIVKILLQDTCDLITTQGQVRGRIYLVFVVQSRAIQCSAVQCSAV